MYCSHIQPCFQKCLESGRKKAHKHKLFALVDVQMALGQTAGCPRVNRANKFMCSPRNTGNINFSLWLTGGLSQGCPDFQKVYVFKVYVSFSCPKIKTHKYKQICGIVPGLGGCQNFVSVLFFRVIPYGGEKHINKVPPKIPGQSRENVVYVFCSLCVFFKVYVPFSCPIERGVGEEECKAKRGGHFFLKNGEGGEGFRGGEVGLCALQLGGCRGEEEG